MIQALFQQIPRGLFEPVAVLGFIGIVLFLYRYWKIDKAETALWGGTVLFMVGWRVIMPIGSGRYVLILLPITIAASVYAIEEIVSFCRKYVRFPQYPLFLAILLGVFCVKSFKGGREDVVIFSMLDELQKKTAPGTGIITVVSDRDVSVFLGDRFDVTYLYVPGDFYVTSLPQGDYYFLKLSRKKKPLDWETAGLEEVARRSWKGSKSDFVLWKRKEN